VNTTVICHSLESRFSLRSNTLSACARETREENKSLAVFFEKNSNRGCEFISDCWGKAEHATLRSTTSSSHHADEGYTHRRRQNKLRGVDRTETCATPFALVLQDEGPVDVYGPPAPSPSGGACVIRPIVMGPVRTSAIRAMSVIRFTLMTICNLPSWEYFGDKPGTRGPKRL
jgi:hypothetical protein